MSTKLGDITISKKEGTVLTLSTNKKYVNDDIYFNIDVTEGSVTQNAPTINSSTGLITATSTVSSGYVSSETKSNTLQLTTQAAQNITPTTTDQTISSGKYLTGTQTIKGDANLTAENIADGVTIFGVEGTHTGGTDVSDTTATSGDVLSGKYFYLSNGTKTQGTIVTKTSLDLSVSGATVTVPAGYYASQVTKDVATGSATTPATTVTANPSISVNASGLITATSSATKSVTPAVSAGYVNAGTAGTITVSGSNTSQLPTQSGTTIAPTESEQTAVAAGKYTTGVVKIGAISSTYVGSDIPQNDSDDLIANDATVTVPAGYYAENATKTIGSGTVVASVSSNSGGSASMAATGFTAASSATSYYVTLSTSAGSVKAKAAGGTAGYVTSSTTNETAATAVSVSGNGNKLYIPTTGVTASVSSNTSGSASMVATGMSPLSSGTSSYYVTLSTSAGSVKAKAVGNGTGIVTSSTQNETNATSVAVSGNNTKMYIPEATFANSATSGTTYTDKSSTGPVLISGDYLYINKGYTPDIKISLAKLVPDGSDVKGHGEYIISGHSAYDNDGTLVAGTIPTLVASDLTVNGGTVTVPLGKYTGANHGTAVSTNVGTGAVTTSFTGDGMSIYFNSGTSSDKNVTITPKYTNTAGYVAEHSTATNNGGTVYYKIKTVSGSIGGSASGGSATAAIANTNSMATITDISGKTAGTDYWQVKATATGSAGSYTPKYTVSTAGWIGSTVTGTAQSVSVSSDSAGKSIYIPKAVIAGSSTNATATTTVAPGTVSISKQDVPSGVTNAASGNATTTAPSSGVYVAVKATAAANSTGTTSSISGSGTATVTGAGYAPTTVTGSVTVSGTATAKTSAKDSAMTYVPINVGSITNNTSGGTSSGTINRGSQIKISAGYHASTVYYTAQSNSGTLTIDTSKNRGTISCNGYANVNVTGINIPKPSSGTNTFDVKVPNGNSTITFRFTVDTSGNVTVTNP